jgi:4'-phosphopantetheinyl transferase
MPLIIKELVATGTLLGVWKKDEDLEFLQSVYPLISSEKKAFNKINNLNRKKEWLTTRILLTEMFEKRITIEYTSHGKPFLNENPIKISISHSKHYVSIISSDQFHLGIDVEHVSQRVNKVAHKFMSDSERSWCRDITQLTACWSAKEAIFKVFERDLYFKDIEIEPFTIVEKKGSFYAFVKKSGFTIEFLLNYILIENNILVYTLKNYDVLS